MTKIVLAIHGIGDQTRNETVLAAATRFRSCWHRNTPLSLGGFHRALEAGRPPFDLGGIGFAEIYWADIPRWVATQGYTLQETVAWARTVVERVNAADDARLQGVDYEHVKDVIEEIITTINVLEALLLVARKAGLFDFNLKKLLDDFVGDVQLIVEFEDLRAKVLARFTAMVESAAKDPDAEIYLVTHSEGTVVAFLSLLAAASAQIPPVWLGQIRGLMTLGSPIGKHLVLWPGLFAAFKRPAASAAALRIPWMNYYDYGDPVGFELDVARQWLGDRGYGNLFDFPPANDIGFSRYYFPGKAHTDYWDDARVFGHFITQVVSPEAPPPHAATLSQPPPTIRWTRVTSYLTPYAAFLALVGVAVYLLYRGIGLVLGLHAPPASHVAHDVGALTLLVAALTAAQRISRLTRAFGWALGAFALFALGVFLFRWLALDTAELRWLATVPALLHLTSTRDGVLLGATAILVIGTLAAQVDRALHARADRPKFFRFFGGVIFAGVVGLAATASTHAVQAGAGAPKGAVWTEVGCAAAFVYLWWLSALLFDLSFVWHRYIRTASVAELVGNPVPPPRQ